MNTLKFSFLPVVIIGVLLFLDGFVSVPAGYAGVLYDRGRGVLAEELSPGLHFKIPFWQKSVLLNTRLQTYTMSIAVGEGDLYGDDSIQALTKDGQKIAMDVTIQYKIEPGQAPVLYEDIGLDYLDKIVRPVARSIVREVATNFNSKELFQIETRKDAESLIQKGISTKYEDNNLILVDALLRNIQFSPQYINAIEEKQIAEQKIKKAEYEREEARVIKERKIIEAEGEAESITIKGKALAINPEVIQLEYVQKMAPNIQWGIMPDTMTPLFIPPVNNTSQVLPLHETE